MSSSARPKNILLIIADQYRHPGNLSEQTEGFDNHLKSILGFQGDVTSSNPYQEFFPGLMRLRKNAVVLKNHMIASSACIPSRSALFTGQYGTRTGVGMIPEKWTVKFHNFLHILKVRDNQGRSEHGFDYKTPLYIL